MPHDTFKRYPETVVIPVLIVVAAGFFSITNPRTVAAPFLIVGFFLIFAILHAASRLMVRIFSEPVGKWGLLTKLLVWGVPGLLTIFLAMQSIGQLTLRDVFVILALCAIGGFYMVRSR